MSEQHDEPLLDDQEPINETTEATETKEATTIKAQNALFEFPVFLKVDTFHPENTKLSLPPAFPSYVVTKIGQAPNTALDDTEKTGHWSNVMQTGLNMVPVEDMYRSSLENADSQWTQGIQTEGKHLKAGFPRFDQARSAELEGERGVLRFLKHVGMGGVFSIPLWHTGIWVSIKSPSESRLLELNRELITDKVNLGRSSHGLALSATTSVFNERLLNLLVEHVYQTNLKTDKHLFDVISAHDIPHLIWGLACVIWNNGFQYERACTHDPEKCNYVEQAKLDLTLLQLVNKQALTPWQIAHMARRKSGEVTEEDLNRYQKEFLNNQVRTITLGSGDSSYQMDLKIPTIRQYLEQSQDWITSMVERVEKAVELSSDANQRNTFISQHAQSTIMRQYTHWVSAIHFGDSTISGKETIEEILNHLSADDETREKFTTEVKKYIDDSVVSLIGIPDYECPACGGKQITETANGNFRTAIPLDVTQTFFYLLVQKVFEITRR